LLADELRKERARDPKQGRNDDPAWIVSRHEQFCDDAHREPD